MQLCYLNGKLTPVSKAKIGVNDIGLLRGFGTYEAMTTFGRRPFMLKAHLERFRRSTAGLKLMLPASDTHIAKILDRLIAHNVKKGKEAVIRMIVTGGEAIGGIEYDRGAPTFYILVEQLAPLAPKFYSKGSSLIIHEFQRQFPEVKTTNYIEAVLLQAERKAAGALEILYVSEGKVLECATSNFFIVKNGVLITAKKNILEGITRKVALDVARPHFKIEIRDVSVDEMYRADEAFLTSSFKGIVPVVKVGKRKIGNGTVGPVTKRVMQLFHEFTRNYE
ncbi:MAG: D-alanine aminotransferase [Candidatus Kaiserbacteria bacterium GW2011_GWC2_52_8b]|uniref:D-alanine aminotransferase n=2 Tax=Candidatus Kaiseribacteriota TaxID=1752734 RepID=A0A0G1ZMX0_9BACT|nr:MAG: D-alanine aminotransferase [Candidatus Kaiserbacteria bacterium GW2011_GWC2_52_8b]